MTPTARQYAVLAAFVAIGASASFVAVMLPIWVASAVVLVLAVGVEFLALRRTEAPRVRREAPGSFALGVETEVELDLRHDSGRTLQVDVFDRPPPHCATPGLPVSLTMEPGESTVVTYMIRPSKRGRFAFDGVDLRVRGPLGLLERVIRAEASEEFRVLPNFRAVSRYALMAVADRTGRLGIRHIRRRGSGMEFSHLREYRDGDLIRQIDWKATARRRQLISREYEDERDQQVLLLLDCGRRMRARDEAIGHFDHCLNASLLLGHIALRKGDGVSVATFGGHDVWVPRQRGPAGINVVLDRIFDLEPTSAPSDFVRTAERIAVRQKKRALIVLVTNLYGDVEEEVSTAVRLLRRNHLVLVASLRESALDRAVDRPVDRLEDALVVGSAHDYLERRERLHRALDRDGVMVLDVPPEELSVQVVNRYLEIKRRGIL